MGKLRYPIELYRESGIEKKRLKKLIGQHRMQMESKERNKRYYLGGHVITNRVRERKAPNNKVICNHAKQIADNSTGYFMGQPITYTKTEEVDIASLLAAFDEAGIDDIDNDNALDMSIFGAAYEYVYAKEGESVPVSKTIDATSAFIVYDDSIEEIPLFGVYYFKEEGEQGKSKWNITVATEHEIYQLEIPDSIEEMSGYLEGSVEHYFGAIPLIEYKNNKYNIGDFEQQIPLIDAYNTLMSDRVNDKEQFIDAILVLYGAALGEDEEETKEAAKSLRENKLLELPADAKAEYLARQLDESGVEILRKALKEDIYTFSHVPNFSDESFAGNTSGVAMAYKLLGLELISKTKERWYRKGLRKRIELYCNFLKLKAVSLEAGAIVPTFSRTLPQNLLELSQLVTNLSNHVSEETLLSILPFVEDPSGEVEKVQKQKEAAVKAQQSLFTQEPNIAPEPSKTEE